MILDSLVQAMMEMDKIPPLEHDLYNLLNKLVTAAKTGDCENEQEELLTRIWEGVSEYYTEGMKAGMQLLHEALTNRG